MEGGRYVVKNGKLERVESPTIPHPEGNAPRDAQGCRLDRPTDNSVPVVTVAAKKKGSRDDA